MLQDRGPQVARPSVLLVATAVIVVYCSRRETYIGREIVSKMRCSVLLACIALTPGVAFNPNNQARLRMQQGFGKQAQSKTPAKLKTPAKAPPPAVPKQTPVRAGELPEDAFSQFPPLTPEQKQTLQKAPGGKATDFPVEVREDATAAAVLAVGGAYLLYAASTSPPFTSPPVSMMVWLVMDRVADM